MIVAGSKDKRPEMYIDGKTARQAAMYDKQTSFVCFCELRPLQRIMVLILQRFLLGISVFELFFTFIT